MQEPSTAPLALGPDDCLRVLFVFAEARGSRPLAARQERLELQRLLRSEIYPQRRVVADFLTHGVTRERLQEHIREQGGYHIVHWSGHGHLNLLELAKPGGAQDRLSGTELLALFTEAGGFLPRLCFRSACHSGDILRVQDWQGFLAVAQGQEPGKKNLPASDSKDISLEERPGYTGTAHALLQGGVPSVVAMRYAIGDDYARDLAVEFSRALLAHAQPKNAAAALTMARQALRRAAGAASTSYAACDHATPVLYGAEEPGLRLQPGRSPGLDTRQPRLQPIAELTITAHAHCVGRTWDLAGLGAEFIGASHGAEIQPVALLTGLGDMGKTALTAEALALWEARFEWVLLYQAKPTALSLDAMLRDIHLKLSAELGRYHDHVQARPADAIYRAADVAFTGPQRLERLTRNLLRALRDEAIWLVLDNFETNLKAQAEPGSTTAPLWTCQDPAWDACLRQLAMGLADTRSLLLITCRRPLAALAGLACHHIQLGPLPADEAALYLREHAGLRRLLCSAAAAEGALARRLLHASRFHPLLMDRLARLATAGSALRPQLLQALATLETRHDYAQLPALFATQPGDAQELAYLGDALATSLDQLIDAASPAARRLLWLIALANEPVALDLLQGVWSGEDGPRQQQLRQIRQALDILPQLPAELKELFKAMPPALRAEIDALPPAPQPQPQPDPAALLRQLLAVGLATAEPSGPDDDHPDLTCHELVRERIQAWMHDHASDRAGMSADSIRLAYAERLEAAFRDLRHQDMSAALQAGSRALVYCVQAGAYARLGDFASSVVNSSTDPLLLAGLLPPLEAAADAAPEGQTRWRCLGILADALESAGRPDASLLFYAQAAAQARRVAEAGGEDGPQAWADIAWITGNWANALREVGDLDAARQRRLDEAEAMQQAGPPAVEVIGSELEVLRLDIMQGQVAQALPQVQARLAQLAAWWQQLRAGQRVPEAPDAEFLARALISALDIAEHAHLALEDWDAALRRVDAVLELKRTLQRPAQDIAVTRMNRANVLGRLGRFREAQAELEACLQVFQHDPASSAGTLGSLASLFDDQGDVPQAITQERRALALRQQLPDPRERAGSHHNLANYLERHGTPSALAESPRHQLAGLIYLLVAGLGQDLQTSLHNYAIRFRRAQAAGTPLAVPPVAALLAVPAFHPLVDWLRQRQVDVAEVQAAVDQVLEQARQAVTEASTPEGDRP